MREISLIGGWSSCSAIALAEASLVSAEETADPRCICRGSERTNRGRGSAVPGPGRAALHTIGDRTRVDLLANSELHAATTSTQRLLDAKGIFGDDLDEPVRPPNRCKFVDALGAALPDCSRCVEAIGRSIDAVRLVQAAHQLNGVAVTGSAPMSWPCRTVAHPADTRSLSRRACGGADDDAGP